MIDILSLPNWSVVNVERDDTCVIHAQFTIRPEHCVKCGSTSIVKHGTTTSSFIDIPYCAHPTVVKAHLSRFRCYDCNAVFVQPHTGMDENMRFTNRCIKYIQRQCLRDTFTRIADDLGCDEKTVRNITSAFVDDLNAKYKPVLTRIIGMDETTIDGKLRFIITDLVDRKPIDMLLDREKPTVSTYLWKHRNDPVEVIAMDMWRGYKSVVYQVFPNAIIVVDKFHVVRMANEAVDKIRLKLSKDRVKAIGQDWKRRKSLLRMRYKNLSEHGKYNLDMWLENEPDIAIAHNLKELFYLIYEMPTREDAESLLDEWLDMIPADMCKGKSDFKPLVTIFKEWRKEIMNYFDHRVTNAYTEALNGVVKVANRQGRGYGFEILRAKVLFSKYHVPEVPYFNVDPNITAEEFKRLEDSFVRCLSCFELHKHRNDDVVCKFCLTRIDPDDEFLTMAEDYGYTTYSE